MSAKNTISFLDGSPKQVEYFIGDIPGGPVQEEPRGPVHWGHAHTANKKTSLT